MSAADYAELIGYLAGSWVLGYCAAFTIAAFKKATGQI